MSDLILTVLCSTSIALIIKYSGLKNETPIILLFANYLAAAIISLVYILIVISTFSFPAVFFGMLLGILFVLSFFAFTQAISLTGTALATVSSRLSVIVPLFFSILIYNESPSLYQIVGFIMAFFTIYLFYLSVKGNKKSVNQDKLKYFYLIAVLVGIGINDFSMKIFQQSFSNTQKPFFLFSIFFSAFVYCLIYIKSKNIRINKSTFFKGAILGIPNVFSTIFLIRALNQLPGVVVFPVTNIGIILLTAILARMIFKEKLTRYGLLSLIFGLISIVFLTTN